jgi:Cu/Ag efflux pump CusA
MFGFVLAIGIVVDDAIIVVESVQHYIDEQKMSAKSNLSRDERYFGTGRGDRTHLLPFLYQ